MSDATPDVTPLPSLSATEQDAWKQMEAAAAAERAALAAGGALAPKPDATTQPKTEATTQQPKPAPTGDDVVPGARKANDGKDYVPLASMLEERGRAKDANAVAEQLRTENATLLKALERAGVRQEEQKPAPVVVEAPKNPHDENLNPLDHAKWEAKQASERAASLEKRMNDEQAQRENAASMQRAHVAYQDAHKEFATKNDGYQKAYEFITGRMIAMNVAQGMSQRDATVQANHDEWGLVMKALQASKNPFQVIWGIAKSQGWTPELAAAQAGKDGKTAADLKVDQLRAAGDVALTLSDQPGGAPSVHSLESLVSMPKESFAELFNATNDPTGEKWRKIAGG